MPATATYSPTGNVYVDGVLSGVKWAVNSLTFSFPTDPALYDLRLAGSDSPGTAWGYYPSTSAVGGDVWFNNSAH